jgi:hypothetical protein
VCTAVLASTLGACVRDRLEGSVASARPSRESSPTLDGGGDASSLAPDGALRRLDGAASPGPAVPIETAVPSFSAQTEDGAPVGTANLLGKRAVVAFHAGDCPEGECAVWRRIAQTGATVVAISKTGHGRGFRALRSGAPASFSLVHDATGDLSRLFSVPWKDFVNYAFVLSDGKIVATFELHDALLMALEILEGLLMERRPAGSSGADDAGPDSATVAASTAVMSTFRYVRVGMVPRRSERLTWVLSRTSARALLRIECQTVRGPLILDGRENLDSTWPEGPVTTVYSGPQVATEPIVYSLVAESGPVNDPTCRELPPHFELRCQSDAAPVLPPDAEMTRQSTSTERLDGWKPNHTERVSGLRCTPTIAGVPWVPQGLTWDPFRPPVFTPPRAKSPGIEWAEEHSDVVQGGAFRWIKGTRSGPGPSDHGPR